MIHLVELDFDQPECLPNVDGNVWVLVRRGPQILGELQVRDFAAARRSLRETAISAFAEPLALAPQDPELGRATTPSLTIIVCTRDRPKLLRGCLDRLTSMSPTADRILVVDNAPTNGDTKTVAADFDVDYLVEPKPGLDRARNAGWRAAATDLVAYVDDDARVDWGFASAIRQGFSAGSVGTVTGLVRPHELISYSQIAFERLEGGMGKGFERRIRSADDVGLRSYSLGVGTNMAFRRAVLEQLGGFDPALDVGTPTRGGGDLDMLWRVLDAGHTAVYEPNALVRHIHRRTRDGLIEQFRDNGTAYRAFLERRAQGDSYLRPLVKREIRRWHTERHVLAPLRSIRHRQLLHAQVLLAEAEGSRRGVTALREGDRSC